VAKLLDYAILNDIHFPFEDRTRYGVALKIIKSLPNLAHIYLNGDIGEFLSVGSWPHHPQDHMKLADEVAYMNKRFDEIEKLFPGVPVTLIEGNHCYRFFRYIRDIAPQMWGLIDCPLLLKFPERPGWKFVPYGPTQLVRCGKSNLYLRHEPLGRGQACAKVTAESSVCDIAFGHTHTYQVYSHRKFGPCPVITKAYSLGWLGDKSRTVFDYRGAKDSWVEGMTVVRAEPTSGDYELTFIDLRKLPVYFQGTKFDAK
jgi:hypothetical protein